jgi:leucyl aminopeptidase (aminopeptidase T)
VAILVTVRIKADPSRVIQLTQTNPDLAERLAEAARECGQLRHEQWYGQDEVIDLDWWQSDAQRQRFLSAHRALLAQWGEAVGAVGWSSDRWGDETSVAVA